MLQGVSARAAGGTAATRSTARASPMPLPTCIPSAAYHSAASRGSPPTRKAGQSLLHPQLPVCRSLLESRRCPDRPCSSYRRSGGAPEPRQDRLPQCCVNAESSGARNHLDLLPDDLGKADRPWPRAADLEQLPGPPASNLDDETLPRDASGVRVATDPASSSAPSACRSSACAGRSST